MPLSKLHVINVCKLNLDEECKYLEEDYLEDGVFNCLKLSSHKNTVDRLTDKNGKNKTAESNMKYGDNCQGYPLFRHKICGYDQKDV